LNAKVSAANAHYQTSKDYYDRISAASKADGVIAPGELERAKNQMMADQAAFDANLYDTPTYKKIDNYLYIITP
jgi:hypothetical protein